jgi:hypothetical protein
MTLLDKLNNFRGAFLTKAVIDRKKKITIERDGRAELIGPQWPEVTFHLNHINHSHYRDGEGPHLFQVGFGMVRDMVEVAELMGESMTVESIKVAMPTSSSGSTPAVVTIAMESGKQITFACSSYSINSRKR